jgi:hypothetical protein
MSVLYKSASGREVTHSSSSALDTFRLCRRKFKLSRIDGWKQKARKASLEIGKCLESALQFYHDNGLKEGDFESEWQRLWLKFADIDLTYTDQEKDWKNVYDLGKDWARLYPILLPTFPIRNPKWQLQFLKELWPGDPSYGGLSFMGYTDMLSTLEDGTRLIIDVKTAAKALPVTSDLMALDGQLRKYAWVSGINQVAFLNFVKCDPSSFRKGVDVTLLEDTRDWKAGQPLVVFKAEEKPVEGSESTQLLLTLGTAETVRIMDEELDLIKGKGSTEAKAAVVSDYLADGRMCVVERSGVTKVKIQFVRGSIPEEDLPEIGQQIGTDMLALQAASENNSFFRDGGVRFPNATCGWCEFLPLCNRNDKLRDETLVQIKPANAIEEKDWLTELESEDGE